MSQLKRVVEPFGEVNVYPSGNKVRVVARFSLSDGRTFEADKDVTVRPTPLAQRKPLP